MTPIRHSSQREAIMEFLKTRKDHPTADVVYQNVKQKFPNISLGTVYRNLTLLSDTGDLLRLHVGDGTDHFDADTSNHYHFVCECCHCVADLPMSSISTIDKAAQKSFDGTIRGHVIYFYGLCYKCGKKSKN